MLLVVMTQQLVRVHSTHIILKEKDDIWYLFFEAMSILKRNVYFTGSSQIT